MNIYEVIKKEAAAEAAKAAIIDGDRQLLYGELFAAVDRSAAELRRHGVGPARRVALLCGDNVEYIVMSLAILSAGAAIVALDSSLAGSEVEALLKEFDVAFVIFEGQRFPLEGAEVIHSGDPRLEPLSMHRRDAVGELPAAYRGLNPAFIRFSSGTTGASKGVVLSHEAIVERTDAADKALCVSDEDCIIWVLSMSYHFVVSILLFLRRGASIVLCCREFLSSLLDGLTRWRGTLIYASPFHYRLMADSDLFSADMMAGMRLAISTAMRLPEADAQAFRDKFGLELAQAYGIIEVGLPFVNCSADAAKRGSVGTLLPDYEQMVVNADADGVGEVQLRGKGMFDAYLSPWQLRAQVLRGGWFATGDLGRVDSDGFLFLVGRKKNVINFAGMKIFPEEVEAALDRHPAIRESLVYGVDHPRYGELPCADVVLEADAEGAEFDSALMRRFCYRFLAPHKVPKRFRCVLRLDRTNSGKVKRWGSFPKEPGVQGGPSTLSTDEKRR